MVLALGADYTIHSHRKLTPILMTVVRRFFHRYQRTIDPYVAKVYCAFRGLLGPGMSVLAGSKKVNCSAVVSMAF